jgi:hypothetical protein
MSNASPSTRGKWKQRNTKALKTSELVALLSYGNIPTTSTSQSGIALHPLLWIPLLSIVHLITLLEDVLLQLQWVRVLSISLGRRYTLPDAEYVEKSETT